MLLDIGADARPPHGARSVSTGPTSTPSGLAIFTWITWAASTPFLFGSKWAPQTQSRTKPLRIFGPNGLRRIIEAINDSNNYELFKQPFPVEIVEVGPGTDFEILPGIAASTFSTPHTEESLALRLKDEDSKLFVYTSDTGFSEDLIPFAKEVDLLLMECSFRRNKPVEKHLELVDAMRFGARVCA